MRINICLFGIILLLYTGCQTSYNDKYLPGNPRLRDRLATPEPGTYLKPAAYSILVSMDDFLEKRDSIPTPPDWMMDLLTVNLRKTVDTLIRGDSLTVPVRIYYPDKESMEGNHPVTLYLHGGGFILGSVEQYHMMVSKIARITGQIIVSAEYRLAPDHPFPAAVLDSYTVLKWLQDHGHEIGADTSAISVMGDSAGGNLATVLTLLCRDRGRPQPCCQILIYPGLTFVESPTPSITYFIENASRPYVLTKEFLRKVRNQYAGEDADLRNPYLSPLEALITPGLPPALIITAECDPLRDDGRRYAKKLKEGGVEVEYLEYSGMIHGFMSLHLILKDAVDAMRQIDEFLADKYYIYDARIQP